MEKLKKYIQMIKLDNILLIILVAVIYHVVLLFGIAAIGHQESSDWLKKDCGDAYIFDRENLRNVRLLKKSDNNHFKRVNNNYIVEYFFEDKYRYLIIREINSEIIENKDNNKLITFLKEKEWIDQESQCYVIDLENETEYGPYSISELEKLYSDKSIHFYDSWWNTTFYEGGIK